MRRGCARLAATATASVALVAAGEAASQTAAAAAAKADPEEMVVLGERRPEADVLAGATLTRIETDPRLREGAGIDDLLAEVPGVQVRRFGGAGGPFEVSIRGSSPQQVPILLDGVRLESALTNRGDLSTICLDVVEGLEVTRGAGAGRVGSGAIGGVVNLVPRRPGEHPATRVRVAGGHFGTVEGSLRHTRRVGETELSLAYCGFHTDGDFDFQRGRSNTGGGSSPIVERINNEADRHSALVRLARPMGDARLRLTFLGGHVERGTPGFEWNQRASAEDENARMLSVIQVDGAFGRPSTAGGAVGTEPRPSPRYAATLAHQFEDNDFEDPEPQPGLDPIDTETRLHTLTPRFVVSGETRGLGARLEAGLLAEGRFETRASNEASRKSRLGGSLRAELTAHWLDDRLRISPSLRLERYEGLSAQWLPALFVEADPLPWLRLRASASRSYRAPSFGELYLPDRGFERGNEDLDPERAWNAEAGLRITSPFEATWADFEIEATIFAGRVDDSIVFQRISPLTSAYVNTGRVDVRGHELALRWSPHDWIRLTAARTVTDAKLDANDARVSGVARSQVDGRLELGPRDRFKLAAEVQYRGRIVTSENFGEIPSRVVFDASASVDLVPLFGRDALGPLASAWLTVRGRNLSDTAVRDARFFPRPGRNGIIALEGVFR